VTSINHPIIGVPNFDPYPTGDLMLPGGFSPTPLQKSWSEFVSWDDDIPYYEKKMCSKPPISFISMRNETLN